MLACSCANPACQVNGCQIAKGLREKCSAAPALVPVFAPYTVPTEGCKPIPALTEADIRRIVADEIAKALAPYMSGLAAHVWLGGAREAL